MAVFTYFYFQYFLKKEKALFKKKTFSLPKIDYGEVWSYAWPTFLFTLSFTLLYSIDVILARHFLPARQAGWYGALSTLGKIIYFLANPISVVLFPMAVKRRTEGKNSQQLFKFSFLVVILISLLLTSAYFLFPQIIMKVFYGPQFLAASPYLGLFGIFLSLYSLAYFLGNFMFSQEGIKAAALFPFLAVLLQTGLIYFFHQDILQILQVSILVCVLLFSLLLIFFLKNDYFKAEK